MPSLLSVVQLESLTAAGLKQPATTPNKERLLQTVQQMASIGCQADGSVCRRGFTDADAAGREQLADWMRAGRKALCSQTTALMLSQWRAHRHICENYSPHKTADDHHGDCSGTKFYHWGALTGMITLVEEGYYHSVPPALSTLSAS